MAFGTQDDTDEVMNEINMVPMIDIMLVLLIIFIITVPVMKHAVNIDLPRATTRPQDVKPQTILLSVDGQGAYYWRRHNRARRRTHDPAAGGGQTRAAAELHIRGDKAVRYERVAQAMAAAQLAGVKKIGFVTEPKSPLREVRICAHSA